MKVANFSARNLGETVIDRFAENRYPAQRHDESHGESTNPDVVRNLMFFAPRRYDKQGDFATYWLNLVTGAAIAIVLHPVTNVHTHRRY